MSQGELFSRPAPVDPQHEPAAPYRRGSHSSWTGARSIEELWAERQRVVLKALAAGPKTRQDLAEVTPYGINGICSVAKALIDKGLIERTGEYDEHDFHGKISRREYLGLTEKGRQP